MLTLAQDSNGKKFSQQDNPFFTAFELRLVGIISFFQVVSDALDFSYFYISLDGSKKGNNRNKWIKLE